MKNFVRVTNGSISLLLKPIIDAFENADVQLRSLNELRNAMQKILKSSTICDYSVAKTKGVIKQNNAVSFFLHVMEQLYLETPKLTQVFEIEQNNLIYCQCGYLTKMDQGMHVF
jgi:hypothetical protein